jgi:glyoxylase-like metal-dependent hydrolase (beta-lactamase superfamily II)
MDARTAETLTYPFATPPAPGEVIEVAPGILWIRMPLPFRLNHVNLYLIDDGDGWAVFDAGIGNERTREIWEALASGPLAGRRLTRAIISHYHPDHIGLAGWLAQRFDVPLLMSQTTYLGCLTISLSPGALDAQPYRDFYLRNGLDATTTNIVATQGHGYLKMVNRLPPTFNRIVAGDSLRIGGRTFEVMSGDGHAPEQMMLYCAAEKLFLAADQVLAKISPNVSVWAYDPFGDPLGLYLRSLRTWRTPAGGRAGAARPSTAVLRIACPLRRARHAPRGTLPGDRRRLPRGPALARGAGAGDFHRPLDPHQMSFAFSEVLSHVNYMVREGRLVWTEPLNGIARVVAPA